MKSKFIYLMGILSLSLVGCNNTQVNTTQKYQFSIVKEGEGGEISGSINGLYSEGSNITLNITLDTNGIFHGFYENSILISDDLTYTFKIEKDTNLVAKFSIDDDGDDNDGDDNEKGSIQTYSHRLNQKEFSGSGYDTTAGTTSNINGLSWSYDAFAFLGQTSDGIQIGSNKAPQVDPWHFKTALNDTIYLTSFSITIYSSTGADFVLNCGDNYVFEETYKNESVRTYEVKDLYEPITQLDLSLSTTAKAIYLHTFSFTAFVPENSSINLSTDLKEAKPVVPGTNGIPLGNYEPITKEEYYKGTDLTLAGAELKSELNSKISNMTKISYGDDTNIMIYTDESVETPGFIYGVFDGDLLPAENNGTWNKEHVWPCSQMKLDGKDPRPSSSTKNHATDLHNLRAACQNSNGAHGNKFYDNDNTSTTFFPNISGESNIVHNYTGDFRGDIARIAFYMYVRYDFLTLDDALDTNNDTSFGKLSTLLEWNKLDPVDEFEIQRNNRIYEYQGNRNPFIDYSYLADQLFI